MLWKGDMGKLMLVWFIDIPPGTFIGVWKTDSCVKYRKVLGIEIGGSLSHYTY